MDRTQDVIREGRDRIQALRDPEAGTTDLPDFLRRHSQEMAAEQGMLCDFDLPFSVRPLQPIVYEELRQIGREAITNACLHSQGKRIDVKLEYCDFGVLLTVQDDGVGIAEEKLKVDRHWGISGMRERTTMIGGSLVVATRPTGGSEIKVLIRAEVAYPKLANQETRL
ncbi:ATP-binding protein [Pseudoxanthomonas sp.]|uniref:sensor histidine kinase n=1 Tax=Pseudoxanthomonas sp. TaxID=1871049 RepID=UPI002FE3432E